jgi:hypothetical protein
MQPRIEASPEPPPAPAVAPPSSSIATPPRTPVPPPRRPWPVTPLGLGLAMFAAGYIATALGAKNMRDECEFAGDRACLRRSYILAIPLAGPIIVSNHTREPAHYAFAAIQGAGLLLIAISAGILLRERQRRPVFNEHGFRISRHGSIRPGIGQLTIQARF